MNKHSSIFLWAYLLAAAGVSQAQTTVAYDSVLARKPGRMNRV